MSHNQLLNPSNGRLPYPVPDPEVTLEAKRRTFLPEYKLRILDEAAQCRKPGERGALLRREGLYSSRLTTGGANYRGRLERLATEEARTQERPADGRERPAASRNCPPASQTGTCGNNHRCPKKLSQLLGLPTMSETDENNGSPA